METVKKDNLVKLFGYLNTFYTEYRYEHKPDCFSMPVKTLPTVKRESELNDYFIARSWNTPAIWKRLDKEKRDYLKASIESFKLISGIIIDKEAGLICLQFPYLASLETLYKAYDLLVDDKLEEMEKDFPQFTEKAMKKEIESLNKIYQHLSMEV